MLVEGVDDSVLFCFSVLIVIIIVIMFNFVRFVSLTILLFNLFFFFKQFLFSQSLFTVNQINPRLHSDSIADVTRFRDQVLSSDSNDSRRRNQSQQQIQCPICLTDSFLPIETNCGHIFCGKTCTIIESINLPRN